MINMASLKENIARIKGGQPMRIVLEHKGLVGRKNHKRYTNRKKAFIVARKKYIENNAEVKSGLQKLAIAKKNHDEFIEKMNALEW